MQTSNKNIVNKDQPMIYPYSIMGAGIPNIRKSELASLEKLNQEKFPKKLCIERSKTHAEENLQKNLENDYTFFDFTSSIKILLEERVFKRCLKEEFKVIYNST